MVPTISVVTALGPDVAEHLPSTAESVLAQRLPDGGELQWVVCVDGPEPAAELPRDDRIRVVCAGRRSGPASCRNIAAAHADAPILRNLDADDVLLPGALAGDVETLADDRYGWCTSEALDLLPDGSTRAFGGPRGDRDVVVGEIVAQWRRSEILDVHVTTLAVRRDAFWAAGGYSALPRGEDVALLARLSVTHRGRHRALPGLLYRKWPGQITSSPRDHVNRVVRDRMTEALGGH